MISLPVKWLKRSQIAVTCLILCLILPLGVVSAAELATDVAVGDSDWQWDLLIFLIVLAASAASAALPLAALKHWTGYWRALALAPMVLITLWLLLILVSKLISADSHPYWMYEVFGWAMFTMIYMVALMTAKRIFEKEDSK